MNDNMSIWNRVCETNPGDTKKVNQRGGFTAIDAYSQIRKATETFGPVGRCWGWTVESAFTNEPSGCFTVMIRFWYKEGEYEGAFNTFGSARTERDGDEAGKKALTDAITKALSYLGFNADIFTGKWDDSKYVEKRAEAEKQNEREANMLKWTMDFIAKMKAAGNAEDRVALFKLHDKIIKKLDKRFLDEITNARIKLEK